MDASTKKLIAIVLTAVMMTSAVGMVGAQETQQQTDSPTDASATVAFSDGTTDGTSVTIDSVNMSEGGFVVIHDDRLLDGDVTGSVIGASEYLEPGETENVTVTLFDGVPEATFDRTELAENETLIAMPHRDTNANETYDFVATNGSADGPYLDNGTAITDSANITVETAQTTGESFVVTGLTAPEAIERGETLNVSASIENSNDEADTQSVEYRFDGNVSVREDVSLDAGESTTITASVDTSEVASDRYVHGVYTREDGQVAQVLIADEIDSFEVTGLTAPESVAPGENVTVNATVSNPNEFANEQPIQFRFDGALVETRNVDIDGESSATVQFEIDTDGTPNGTYIYSVLSNDFGADAVVTVGAPDDGDEAEDGEDAEEGDEAEDGEDAEEGEETEEGEEAEDGDEAEDGEETEDSEDAEEGEETEDGDEAEDGEETEDGEDAEEGEETEDGENAEEGEETEDGDEAEDGDSGTDDSDAEEPETPEGG